MSESWATSDGPDLHLEVSRPHVRRGLEDALRTAVREGRLRAGTRLPSSRSLALDLGVARNTVAAAYAQLVAEGWLEARQGSTTRVASRPAPPEPVEPAGADAEARARYDLRPGRPDLAAFPRSAWLTAMRRALNEARLDALDYGDPRGLPELRVALAAYLARARGVSVRADRVVICSGFTQGLALVCRALRARGARRLAVETYGHRIHRDAVAGAGLEPVFLPVDGRGAEVALLHDVGGALLTPAHQFPLGPVLAPARRLHAVSWARQEGAFVIEDDYDGEFRYDRKPVAAMQALEPEHVVYAGTASKSLAPGLRLGWLVVPRDLLEPVLDARALLGGPGVLDQLAMAGLIASGRYDRQVRRSRLAYRRRRDRLVAQLRRRAPQVAVTGTAAGLHAVVTLPQGRSEVEVVEAARGRGLLVQGLDDFRNGGDPQRPSLVVGYGTPPEHAFSTALGRLAGLLGR